MRALKINDVDVSATPVEYVCYGLGSCIGLFVTDRVSKLSGGAHIPLPSHVEGEFKDAVRLVDDLVNTFRNRGSDLTGLRAKIAGGAKVYKTLNDIGIQNAQEVLRQLINRKIFIAAVDIGGHVSRTTRFNSVTGDLHISTSDEKTYCI